MAMTIASNYSANVAYRYLKESDNDATRSLAKLSAGTRVLSGRDDAASLAIGKRLESETAALRQASVNAGQAGSMLQIADGALSSISDVLTRMKTLATQAASDQVSDAERVYLNDEFTSLRSEIDRIAGDTEFNGQKLINGSQTVTAGTIGTDIESADGFGAITFDNNAANVSNADQFSIAFDSATSRFTVTNTTTGVAQTSEQVTAAPAAGATQDVRFDQFGLTLTLTSDFDPATDITANNTFDATVANNASTTFTYKIGTGTTAAEDDLAFTLDSAAVASLSAGLAADTLDTRANAETAIDNVAAAIDEVNDRRAGIGANQNRLEFAAANLASSIENSEAARSELLDLDIASEMTAFTSKQILMQAGVSMLAQANQMPQNLLKLLS
ncbi:flagellin [Tistrella mobilis]|uniref:Flagellin n=1 Tax=Tistrella mobilis (strain KA081020-065) TaxID=1110502 RepID=I3TJH8_TISMK|nr:flagellin [Tistrella mobilis]AFK52916.1 flagellin [Tistrella mobilis KA081020-065]MAM73312.1 flagellin [Tistrella sp.]